MAVGAPKGNNNAAKGRRFARVLTQRLETRGDLEKVIDVLIDKALDGDMQALKEVADRIDGKAKESIDLSSEDGTMSPTRIVIEAASAIGDDTAST